MRASDEVLGVLCVRNVRVARASDDAADVAGYIVVVFFRVSVIFLVCAFSGVCRHVAVVVDVVYRDSVGLAVGGFPRLSGDASGVGD